MRSLKRVSALIGAGLIVALTLSFVSFLPWQRVSWHTSSPETFAVASGSHIRIPDSRHAIVRHGPAHGHMIQSSLGWRYHADRSYSGVDWVALSPRHCLHDCASRPARVMRFLVVGALRFRPTTLVIPFGGHVSYDIGRLTMPRFPTVSLNDLTLAMCPQACSEVSTTRWRAALVGHTLSLSARDSYWGHAGRLHLVASDRVGHRTSAFLHVRITRPRAPRVRDAQHLVALGATTTFRNIVTTTVSLVDDPISVCFEDRGSCRTELDTTHAQWQIENGGIRALMYAGHHDIVTIRATDVTGRVARGHLRLAVPSGPIARSRVIAVGYGHSVAIGVSRFVALGTYRVALDPASLRIDSGALAWSDQCSTVRVREGQIEFVPMVTCGGRDIRIEYEIANRLGQRASAHLVFRVARPPAPIAKSTAIAVLPGTTAYVDLTASSRGLIQATNPTTCVVTNVACSVVGRATPLSWRINYRYAQISVDVRAPRGSVTQLRYRVTDSVGAQAEGVISVQVAGMAHLDPVVVHVQPGKRRILLPHSTSPLAPWRRGSWVLCSNDSLDSCHFAELTVNGARHVSISPSGIIHVTTSPRFVGTLPNFWIGVSDTLGQTTMAPVTISVEP